MHRKIKNHIASLDYRTRVMTALTILVVLGAFVCIYIKHTSGPSFDLSPGRVVTLNKEGFSPFRLVVKQGDTVTFKNNTGTEMWPASGPHPTHDIYPDFDPRRPIAPGQSWDFTFTRAGLWNYHNHLASNEEGQVVVLTYKGDFVNTTCTDENQPTTDCFQTKVVSVLNKKGLEKALDMMSELYDTQPEFRGSCHSVAHTLGRSAYALFEKGENIPLNSKTSYCSYGFYHGFMEEMLQVSGNFEEARKFCTAAGKALSKESANAEGACYHGIGHGTVDGSDPRNWGDPKAMITPGLEICDKVDPTEPHFYRCASGAFNSLSLMYISNEYDMKLKDGNPFDVCKNWTEFRIANPCYQEMNTLVSKVTGGSLVLGIKLVETIPDPKYAKLAMTSLAGVRPSYFVPPFDKDFKETIDACHGARADLIISCIQGIPSGIMEFGNPGKEYIPAIDFCLSSLLTENERVSCLNTAFGGVRAYYPPEKQTAVCATVPQKYRQSCIRP